MQLRQFLEAVKQAVEIGAGQRGDRLDRNLTARDLLELGVATLGGGGRLVRDASDGGAIRATGADADFVETPLRPSNVAANGIFTRVVLSWDPPSYQGHSLTEIWRGPDGTFANASLVGTQAANIHVDLVGGSFSGAYWVRHVNRLDERGPFAGPFAAETDPEAQFILEELTGKITESQLLASLQARIDLIDGPDSDPNTVAGQVLAEAQARIQDVANEAQTRAQAIADEAQARATEIAAAQATLQNDIDTRATITQLDQAIADEEQARATSLQTLETNLQSDIDTRATITQLDDAITTEQDARATSLQTLETNLQSDIDTRATITQLNDAISSEEQSRATALTSLETTLQSDIDTRATITQLDDAIANETSARTTSLETLEANLQSDIDTRATTTELTSAIATEQDARASAIQQVTATVDGVSTAVQINSQAITDVENNVYAEFTVKLDANGLVSGLGLINDGESSEFGVLADRFWVASPGQSFSQDLVPFAIDGGQTVIKDAVIPNASITTAKIQDAFLENLTAVHGQLSTARINMAEIWDLSIGNEIRSENFEPGGTGGFRISKSGTAELKNANVSGTITGSLIQGTIIESSIFIGSEFLLPTDMDPGDGTFLAIAGELNWASGSGQWNQSTTWRSLSNALNIVSANNSDLDNNRRYMRQFIDAQVDVTASGSIMFCQMTGGGPQPASRNPVSNNRYAFRVRQGGSIVLDTGTISGDSTASGSGWRTERTVSTASICCGDDKFGTSCSSGSAVTAIRLVLDGWEYTGDGELTFEFRWWNTGSNAEFSLSGSGQSTANNVPL